MDEVTRMTLNKEVTITNILDAVDKLKEFGCTPTHIIFVVNSEDNSITLFNKHNFDEEESGAVKLTRRCTGLCKCCTEKLDKERVKQILVKLGDYYHVKAILFQLGFFDDVKCKRCNCDLKKHPLIPLTKKNLDCDLFQTDIVEDIDLEQWGKTR